jgi:endonuclease III
MTKNEKKILANYVLKTLKKTFPHAKIELDYNKNDPWQLLVVVALSAQTTDKKVNQISSALFNRFKTMEDFFTAKPEEIEPYIKSIGLYRNKARNLIKAAEQILKNFNGKVPKDRKQLETLAGVGKKTSAVIVANAFNIPALAVDTHVARVSQRLGLTKETNPDKIEKELTQLFTKKDLLVAHHTLIFHGRRICIAKKPRCSICPLLDKCPRIGVTIWQ